MLILIFVTWHIFHTVIGWGAFFFFFYKINIHIIFLNDIHFMAFWDTSSRHEPCNTVLYFFCYFYIGFIVLGIQDTSNKKQKMDLFLKFHGDKKLWAKIHNNQPKYFQRPFWLSFELQQNSWAWLHLSKQPFITFLILLRNTLFWWYLNGFLMRFFFYSTVRRISTFSSPTTAKQQTAS